MYDARTRRAIASELAPAFLDGRRRAEDLAERGAGVLHPRPEWLDALAFALEAESRTGSLVEPSAIGAFVERFLRGRTRRIGDPPAPQIIRRMGPRLRHAWPIASIDAVGTLADMLELSPGQLDWLADVRGLERTVADERLRNYRYRWLPRRSGVPRLIEAPKLRLKEIQRRLLHTVLDPVAPHPAAHGFTRGRSVHTHAALHCARPAVLRLDLRDFFASVPAGRVFGIFATLGYERRVAHVLTGLTTNTTARIAADGLPAASRDELVWPRARLLRALATPHLPQGAPTSPALANLAALGLDRRLAGLSDARGLGYSRYADDLVFSGPGLSGPGSRRLAERVAEIARDEGFRLNPAKSRLRTAARRQTVAGVVVNAHPNLARDEYDRLRATLHRAARDGPGAMTAPGIPASGTVDLRAHLHGRVVWAESLHPGRGAKLRRLLDAIEWDGPPA